MGYWGKPIWRVAADEVKRNWHVVTGFVVTGFVVTKVSLGLTPEQAKHSDFVKLHGKEDHH